MRASSPVDPARAAAALGGASRLAPHAVAEVAGDAARAAFAAAALGGAAPAADPFAGVRTEWSCPPELPRAYRAATGAAHDGVPLDLALTLAWPGLAGLLAVPELAARLSELVHASHAVHPGDAWPPRLGEQGRAEARLVEVRDPADGPTRLACHARLTSDRGVIADVEAELAILGGAPATSFALRRRDVHDVPLAEQPRFRGEVVDGRVHVRAATTQTSAGTFEGEAARAAPAGLERRARPAVPVGEGEDVAPVSMEAFARVGGDRNPLHRSVLAARLAGLPRPIVHGAWTAARAGAFVVDELCDGDATRLRDWRVSFLAPVELGAPLDFDATRVALSAGRRVVQVRVRSGEVDVAAGEALVDAPPTALLFPGQGIQRPGLSRTGARRVWTRADAHTRRELGFSLLEVVDENPRELRLADGSIRRHPLGVLFRTEFTQPALLALAAAQLAELRAEGALGDITIAAGHSVGEFAALHALGVLELETALELVYRRGVAMQEHVPRGPDGASPYRLAVVKDIEGLEGVEVVNYNAPDQQYAIVGTADAIAALGRRARVLPGIDVPFHSSVLSGAVEALRPYLEEAEIDPAPLIGRWIPNLLGRPFAAGDDVVDLLARQLASPVQWIATQHALAGLGVKRFLEVAPAHAEVLTGLARMTVTGIELLHAERDRDAVLERAEVSAPVAVPTGADTSARPPAHATPVTDRPVDAGHALEFVLALQARVRLDQLDPAESLDELFQGVSSRRNQVLIDLGREFGLSGAEDVQRQTLGELVKSLREQGAAYRFPGAYLREALAAGLARAGVARDADVGLGPGLTQHVLARVALDTRPGPSARGGPLARLESRPDLLDRAIELTGNDLGIALARRVATSPVEPAVAVSPRVEDALLDSARALADGLGRPFAPEGEPPTAPDPDRARLAILDAELGEGRANEIAPRFDARRHVRFTSAWASARWDLVTAYHDARAGRLSEADLAEELDRLAAHAHEPAFAATAAWYAQRDPRFAAVLPAPGATGAGNSTASGAAGASGAAEAPGPAGASALAGASGASGAAGPSGPAGARGAAGASGAVGARGAAGASGAAGARGVVGGWSALPVRGVRPVVELSDAGVPVVGVKDDPSRPGDLIDVLPALAETLAASLVTSPDLRGQTALVTGASPGSIAVALVARLLRGGARVVVATSTDTPARRRFYRDLYRRSAGPEAELHVVPANLASFGDIDALVDWLRQPGGGRRGRDDLRVDPLTPTILAPFAALSTTGDASEAGAAFETAVRLQWLGVQRLIGALAARSPITVLLPLSPNHGAFGGDGPYGETKAALEVMLRRARSEPWGANATLIAPRIGWVRGTGLMGANDPVAPLVEERLGVRTFAPDELAWVLTALLTAGIDGEVDLSGGLPHDLRAAVQPLADELRERSARRERAPEPPDDRVEALPLAGTDAAPRALHDLPEHGLAPEDLVVIVGTGELGPGGTGRTRFALELDEADSPGVVAELAWLTGLVRYEVEQYRGRWIDVASGDEVPEERLAERYATQVATRVGVRAVEHDGTIDPRGHTVLTQVSAERPITFAVATEAEAHSFANATLRRDGERWLVTTNVPVRVPKTVPYTRRVAGQLPHGLDLARFGLPADLVATADRMALVNLASTVEAFADAGLTPEELADHVHPANVANTQGAGMGGMASLRALMLDHLLGQERQNDRLQESLGNVVAAHTVQAYLGSYGPMVHPVAACATAAVSLEEAHDKIKAGKALAVLAGGFDDLTPEGMLGFADMGATASSDALDAMGLAPHEASRANDTRRAGFVEAQGGGAQLVVRGDVALALGLPVRGVLAYAGSFGDGLHTSIPAAGMGALASAQPLKRALERHGLTADDLGVVSKHDTSTEMNDPAEADLHERLQTALGRTPGNPLLVVSQKTVTGHAKGGAAAWQLDGVLRMLETGTIPGNRNLESVDPLERTGLHLALGDRPIRLAEPLKAALIASLGFGHVSAILAIAHPDTFHAAIPAATRDDYLARAGLRRARGAQRRLDTRLGRPAPIRRAKYLDRDAEAKLLLER